METRKANIYTDSSAQLLETFSNAPCLHRKWRVAYALDSAAVIFASSNGAIPADVKAFKTHFSNTVTVLRAQRRQVALRRPYDECNGRFSPFATIAGAMDNSACRLSPRISAVTMARLGKTTRRQARKFPARCDHESRPGHPPGQPYPRGEKVDQLRYVLQA
jgi:hypothetical protein